MALIPETSNTYPCQPIEGEGDPGVQTGEIGYT